MNTAMIFVVLYVVLWYVVWDFGIKMAAALKLACILLLVFINLQVKKAAFVGSDPIGLSIAGKEIVSSKGTFILLSLWQAKTAKRGIHVFTAPEGLPFQLTALRLWLGAPYRTV